MSTIQDIEALSFAELKTRREELAQSLRDAVENGEVKPEAVVARYLNSLRDAKMRDEKLGEQGRTITELQHALLDLRTRLAECEQVKLQQAGDLDTLRTSARETSQADKAALAAATESLQRETARADRLAALATRRHAAMAQIAKVSGEAIGQDAVDAANEG